MHKYVMHTLAACRRVDKQQQQRQQQQQQQQQQQGKHEEALQEAFLILRKDKAWEGGKVRTFCVHVFDALGEGHPLVKAGRRRLSNLLF